MVQESPDELSHKNVLANEGHITKSAQNPPPDTSLSVPVTTHLTLHLATTLIHPQCPALLQSPTVAPFRVQLKGGLPTPLAPHAGAHQAPLAYTMF